MIRKLAILLALPIAAFAHTTLLNSTPASGAELPQSPPAIELQFRDQARLTAVSVVGPDKASRRLEFAASDKPNGFRIQNPMLAAGRSEITWTGLSKDGHVITGKLNFVIKPAPKN